MRKRWVIGLVAVVVVGFAIARRHDLLRFAIERGAGLAGGYSVRIADQRVGLHQTALFGVHVARGGEPLLDAKRIDIRYSLRDLFPGSTHRFGLVALDATGAELTIARFADGSYNLGLPQSAAPAIPAPQRVDSVPIRFTLRVHDAALDLLEPNAADGSARNIRVHNFNVDASIDTAAVTRYHASGAFQEKHEEPFAIVGVIDAVRSFAMHHAHAARFPLRALANYFSDTPAVRILAGRARNFDARVYSLDVEPNAAPSYHVNLHLDVDGGRLALASLAIPVEGIRGHLQLVDNAFFLKHVDATLAGIPLHVTGGIYDLTGSLTGSAQLRLGIYGTGDLSQLRNAFTFTRAEPVSGRMTLGVLVEGPIDNPLIVANGNAARTIYRALPFDALEAGIVYHDSVVALAPLHASYGGTDVGIRGVLNVGAHLQSQLVLHVRGTANRLPYLDEMLGSEPMLVDAVANGNDFLFHVRGAAASARGVARVAALVALEPDGTGSVEPFWLHTERGDFDGGYLLDRRHGTSAFWALASNLQMHAPSHTAFPGLQLLAIPDISARAAGFTIAGGGSGTDVAIAGLVSAGRSTIAGVKFDRVNAAFGGTFTDAAVNLLHASGPWGEFDGGGAFSSQRFVARGTYRGTFEGLQPFLGSAMPARGAISGTAAIAVEPSGIVVQGSHLAMRGATLRGVPISGADVTLAVEGNRLRVYSAHAQAAGGDVVAAGNYSLASRPKRSTDTLSLVVEHLAAGELRGIGLPLDAGRLAASGNLAAGAPLPRFDGGVTVAGGRMQKYAVTGGGDVHTSGDAASLHHIVGALGGTYLRVDGSIGALSSGTPAYALDTDVPAASIAGALRTFGIAPAFPTDGSFNARLRIGGRGLAPTVAGSVGVPAGSVNGLPFIDGRARIAGGMTGMSLHKGYVLVGTTGAHFAATAQPGKSRLHVDAPRADLSDFNNFFDTGDTLDGDGSVKFVAAMSGNRFSSSGDIDIRAFRYRNLPIGDTRASWSSARDAVTGSLAVGGSEGLLRAHGSVVLSPEEQLQSTLLQSRYDLSGTISDLDLSLWIPALGFPSVPITGRASGELAVRGRFPLVDLRGSARIDDGTIGPLTLEKAEVAVHSAGSRIAIDRAELTTPGLSASASGSLGLQPAQPLDVQVHAATDDLPQLVQQLTRVTVPVTGAFESTLQIGGTFKAPTFQAGIDATGVEAYGIPIASLFGEVRLHGRTLVLSNAGATFAAGEATLAGSLPLELAPFRLGPADQPVNVDLDVVDLNPSIFEPMLGNGTKLGGTVNGHVGLSGTVRQPVIVGNASLANGSYTSNLERVPITKAVGRLSFDHTSAVIDRVSAALGSGSVQSSGRVEFPHGFGSADGLSFRIQGSAKAAQLDLPAYGSGTLDADVTLTKTPAAQALLAGNATLSNATLAFAAFINAAKQSSAVSGAPLPLAFDLNATAGKNVRVRGSGYGAGLDIGASGSVRLTGTLAAPTLFGTISSTGGTLTYFDRAFRVQEGAVRFEPGGGVLPTLHAVATTNVVNPDPDRARNPYGSADVTITVDGPIEGLKIGFTSNPAGYTRDQIIALIAPLGGFIGGVAFSNQSAVQVQQPGGITPLGAVSPIPNVVLQQRSSITVGQEAFNLLNAQFTAGLLSPIESAVGQGLGFSSVNLTLGYYGNVGVRATRVLGKAVSAVYATTFGIPQVQSFGVQVKPGPYSSATLNFYYQSGPTRLFETPQVAIASNQGLLVGAPLQGNSGFSLTFQHYF